MKALILIAVIYPIMNGIYILLPLKLFNKNIYLLGITTFAVFLFVRSVFVTPKKTFFSTYLMMVLVGIVFLFRFFYYEEIGSVNLRAPLIWALYWICVYSNVKKTNYRTFYNVIVFSCVFQALLGFVHFYVFPDLILSSDILAAMGENDKLYLFSNQHLGAFREAGLLFNPNTFGDLLFIGLFLVLHDIQHRSSKTRPVVSLILVAVLAWGIVLSGSRYPIGMTVLLLVYYSFKTFSARTLAAAVVFGALISFTHLLPLLKGNYDRLLRDGNRIRSGKNSIALEMTLDSPAHFLIGTPDNAVANTRTAEGYIVSDNSFFTFVLSFGVPFVLYFIAFSIQQLRRYFQRNLFFLIFFLGVLWFSNAVLWEVWLLYAFIALAVMKEMGMAAQLEREGTVAPSPDSRPKAGLNSSSFEVAR